MHAYSLIVYAYPLTCSILPYMYVQDTKQKISDLLAVEEKRRKTQQELLSSSSKEENDDSVDTTQGNYVI